jgi:hypothetical protein
VLLPFEAQLAVGVVLEDDRLVLVRQRDQLFTPAARHGRPRRVLEIHDGVDELARLAFAPELFELLARHARDHALGVHRHVEHARAVAPDRRQRAGEGRRLAEDRIAHVHESTEGQGERVPRAIRHDDVIRRDVEVLEEPVLLDDQVAQALVALRLAVGQRRRALGLHHVGRGFDHALVRKGGGVGVAAAEFELGIGHGPGRRGGRAPADAGAGGQERVETGVRWSGHGW